MKSEAKKEGFSNVKSIMFLKQENLRFCFIKSDEISYKILNKISFIYISKERISVFQRVFDTNSTKQFLK